MTLPCDADAKGAERAAREVDSLRAYAFRALRFLFSMERNRKVGGDEVELGSACYYNEQQGKEAGRWVWVWVVVGTTGGQL